MWDHLMCGCGHMKMLHGGRYDDDCRLCWQASKLHDYKRPVCLGYRWRWLRFGRAAVG